MARDYKIPNQVVERAFVEIIGDPSSGIASREYEVPLHIEPADFGEDDFHPYIEDVREQIKKLYVLVSGESNVHVSFDYEIRWKVVNDLKRSLTAAGVDIESAIDCIGKEIAETNEELGFCSTPMLEGRNSIRAIPGVSSDLIAQELIYFVIVELGRRGEIEITKSSEGDTKGLPDFEIQVAKRESQSL